jgi:hypothetical protein
MLIWSRRLYQEIGAPQQLSYRQLTQQHLTLEELNKTGNGTRETGNSCSIRMSDALAREVLLGHAAAGRKLDWPARKRSRRQGRKLLSVISFLLVD